MSVYEPFVKKHDYLVCVDSDGCAMDTMYSKHVLCFGPLLVQEWGLQQWKDAILRRWNDINLYQMTRGINRFQSLVMALSEIHEKYTPIVGLDALKLWVETAHALSNEYLEEAVAAAQNEDARLCLQKALLWSYAVNDNITKLPEELKVPFRGARECIAAAAEFADIAIVSSANRDAVEEEWEKYGLLEHADILLAQDCGSTAHCIGCMLDFGYEKDHVLMVGDAPGDCEAAEACGVWFYPILVNWEEESWSALAQKYLQLFHQGKYATCQEEKEQVFIENLGG